MKTNPYSSYENAKPLTIEELNTLNTVKIKKEHDEYRSQMLLNSCIIEINKVLRREWHNITNDKIFYIDLTGIFLNYDIFDKAKTMFLENGIEVSYYQPHSRLGFKKVK